MLLPQCRQRCLTMDAPLLQRRSLQRLGSSVWHKLRAASKKVPWNSSIYGTPTTTSLKSRYQTDIITTYNYLNYPNTSPTSMTIEDRQPRCCSSSKKVVEHNSNFTRAYARSGGFHDINHPASLGYLHDYGKPQKSVPPWDQPINIASISPRNGPTRFVRSNCSTSHVHFDACSMQKGPSLQRSGMTWHEIALDLAYNQWIDGSSKKSIHEDEQSHYTEIMGIIIGNK